MVRWDVLRLIKPHANTTSHNLASDFIVAKPSKRPTHVAIGLVVTAALVVIGVAAWSAIAAQKSSLPAAILKQVQFAPYFYTADIPMGYASKPSDIIYSKGVLSTRLTKPGSPDVTISQQTMPKELRPEDVLTGNRKLNIPFGVGTLNQVEGRWLGSIVTNDPQPVLILISSQSSENEPVVTTLAEALSKVR